jgi:photosystem II stability/assembly factor-like uncharacterized protein
MPAPITDRIFAIYFIDTSKGWVAGEEGMLLKTADGGLTWEKVPSGVMSNLYVLKFLDNQIGWVAGSNGIVHYTTDGGVSWLAGVTNTQLPIIDLDFSDPNYGAAAAFEGWQPVSAWLETSDGGKTWKVNESFDPAYEAVSVLDGDVWLAGGWTGGKIWGPGGKSFSIQTPAVSCHYRSIHFKDSEHGWVVGLCGLATFTQDGGENWSSMGLEENVNWTMIRFISDQEAVIAGTKYDGTDSYRIVILHSSDGGITWHE